MFISQENKVDYREKNGINGINNGINNTSNNAVNNIVNINVNRVNDESNPIHNIIDRFSSDKCPESPPRKKFPWIKDERPKKSSINICDIVTVKQMPTATFVTLDDSEGEQHCTPSPPLIDENDVNYDNNKKNESKVIFNNNNNLSNNSFNNISNGITEESDKLKEVNEKSDRSPPPRNEREVCTLNTS